MANQKQHQSKNTSLEDLAQDLAGQPIVFKKRSSAAPKITSIEAAFRSSDPVLAALYKDLKNSMDNYSTARSAYGDDDAMLEIIADQVDSARSAYDTRLLELKANRGMIAEGLMRYKSAQETDDEEKRLKAIEKKEEAIREHWRQWYMRLRIAQQQRGKNAIWGWLLVLLLFWQAQHHRKHLQSIQKRI